jgi:formylglycine-generating enzyme required for sulfatase activity
MWDAVMGVENDYSTLKDPQRPARNMNCVEIQKFLKILSEKNKRTVRLPGDAEWEYAARVGTSNPQLPEKYKDQNSAGKGRNECLPVKSKQPNAWGIYDIICPGAFELARDKTQLYNRNDEVDPYLSAEADEAAGKPHKHWGNTSVWFHEEIGFPGFSDPNAKRRTDETYGSPKIRVALDATKEEIEEMEKMEKAK